MRTIVTDVHGYKDLNVMGSLRRRTGRAERMGRKIYVGFWWGNMKERDYLEGLVVDGRIILMRTLKIGW